MSAEERVALADLVMASVVIPGPVRAGKSEGIVLTRSEAMRAVDAILAAGWVSPARHAEVVAERDAALGEDDGGWHCAHDWMLRPESDTRECLICGTER